MPSYLVTGTARGIGFALVNELSSNGSNLVFAIVRETSDTSLLKGLKRSNLIIVKADISSQEDIQKAFKIISTKTNSLDVLIASAAYLPVATQSPVEVTEDFAAFSSEVNKSIKVNVLDQIYLINIFLPLLEKGDIRKIVFISSGLSAMSFVLKTEIQFQMPYSLSKAALNLISAKFALALKSKGFTVLAICPGLVSSSSQAPLSEEEIRKQYGLFVDHLKLTNPEYKRPLTPPESASAILKTIDYASPYLSGKFLSHFGSEHEWV
ncbi:uncharacterized protein PRCAT00005811001 [Priceomyces carsonii]|uniref:uncharacterized protein n=1 Tax=Priceomyces carsonii TaxID=28549 RepID=UPI002EDBA669|nr:unnamed protein product [Priceomyces carsonii]